MAYYIIGDLPYKLKALAIKRLKEQERPMRNKDDACLSKLSVGSFLWGETPEGHDFWSGLYYKGIIPKKYDLLNTYEIC